MLDTVRFRITAAAAGAVLAIGSAGGLRLALGATPGPETPAALAAQLSATQLAGQRVIYSYGGLTPPASLLAAIRAGDAAGVILFRDNITSRSQISSVDATLQAAARQSPIKAPLLIMTDQEGGQVRRLPGQPTLSEKQIGQSPNANVQATVAGRDAGLNLKSAGIDVNLAPVLDVYRQPGDFDDRYGRSYNSRPQIVARLGADFIRAQQQVGVAATAKHFPGLGAALRNEDTDLAPVTIGQSLTTLRAVDELPYQAAIAAHVRLVMVSWGVYPAIDPRRPAGLSATVVQQELRGRLRFSGVTISDALGAGALRSYGSTAKRAVLAAGAGIDLLLCASQRPSEGNMARDALAGALRSGSLNSADFSSSVRRVLALRLALGR
jgi:beta-N-acetylhexosaminidase